MSRWKSSFANFSCWYLLRLMTLSDLQYTQHILKWLCVQIEGAHRGICRCLSTTKILPLLKFIWKLKSKLLKCLNRTKTDLFILQRKSDNGRRLFHQRLSFLVFQSPRGKLSRRSHLSHRRCGSFVVNHGQSSEIPMSWQSWTSQYSAMLMFRLVGILYGSVSSSANQLSNIGHN